MDPFPFPTSVWCGYENSEYFLVVKYQEFSNKLHAIVVSHPLIFKATILYFTLNHDCLVDCLFFGQRKGMALEMEPIWNSKVWWRRSCHILRRSNVHVTSKSYNWCNALPHRSEFLSLRISLNMRKLTINNYFYIMNKSWQFTSMNEKNTKHEFLLRAVHTCCRSFTFDLKMCRLSGLLLPLEYTHSIKQDFLLTFAPTIAWVVHFTIFTLTFYSLHERKKYALNAKTVVGALKPPHIWCATDIIVQQQKKKREIFTNIYWVWSWRCQTNTKKTHTYSTKTQ